ncbi:MAG TPA: succinylglutamate desuccinylase/aspartoacylase family protein [Casimicrobiaceae bacterium]|nr:succinylglutamate desuccinylase/aspartoacylase family protein [Casimicrobiaceae bacterium]
MNETLRDTLQRAPSFHPRIEIAFPDLAPYAAGNDGTPYVWTFANGDPGPHVLIQALTHGNEVCGAIAIDWLLREKIRPARGRLTLVFANVGAYLRFDRADPFESRCVDEDFNRLWTREVLDGPRRSAELARARELRPIVDRTDHLLDLHSMSEPCLPLAMAGRQRKGVELAKAIGVPQYIVIDSGHIAGQRLRDYAFFDDPTDARSALLVECGQHWEAAAPQVARQSLLRFLDHFGMLERGLAERHLDEGTPPPQRIVEVTSTVTIVSDAFRFTQPVHGLQVIGRAGTAYAMDGGTEIRTPHDDCVLIMPTRKPKRGETAVRLGRFVS